MRKPRQPSRLDSQFFSDRKFSLTRVKRQKFPRTQMQSCGNVQYVKRAMPSRTRTALRNDSSQPMNIRPIDWNRQNRFGIYVHLEFSEHCFRNSQRVTVAFIARIQPDLKSNTLAKLVKNQTGNVQLLWHHGEVRRSNFGIVLTNIKSAKE